MNFEDYYKGLITESINHFVAHIVSELHLDTSGDYYNVIEGETVGIASIGDHGKDSERPDSPNRAYRMQRIEVLAIKGYANETEYKQKVPVELAFISHAIAKYNRFKIPSKNFLGVEWDGRDITPVPRQPIRTQYEQSPAWIVDIPFGVIFRYQSNLNIYGEFVE